VFGPIIYVLAYSLRCVYHSFLQYLRRDLLGRPFNISDPEDWNYKFELTLVVLQNILDRHRYPLSAYMQNIRKDPICAYPKPASCGGNCVVTTNLASDQRQLLLHNDVSAWIVSCLPC